MNDYYGILGISSEATFKDVKSAFRKQAKKHHPDTRSPAEASGRSSRGHDSTTILNDASFMRLLLEAYRILSDPEKRRAYDRLRRKHLLDERCGFDYRRFLKERIKESGRPDPESLAKLIVYDLLHEFEDEALEVYDRAKSSADFRLERWLDRGEAMDTELYIAEEFEKRGRWLRANSIYQRLICMEAEKPWFRYYFDVVVLNFRNLVLTKLNTAVDEDDYLDRLEDAVALPIPDPDRARFLRKKAELHLRRGEKNEATHCVLRAGSLSPDLAGLAALRRKIGLGYSGPTRPQ